MQVSHLEKNMVEQSGLFIPEFIMHANGAKIIICGIGIYDLLGMRQSWNFRI